MLKFYGAALALTVAMPAAAVTVTYGATSDFAGPTLVETFASTAAVNATQTFSDNIGGVDFHYSGVNVGDYGYGNGTKYAGAYDGPFASSGSYVLTFDHSQHYFGLLITAADPTNVLDFYSGDTLVYSYTLGSHFTGDSFVNFAFGAQSFDSATFRAGPNTGFESDNHTIAGAVPEPETWALLLVGFGAVGVGLRRSRRVVSA